MRQSAVIGTVGVFSSRDPEIEQWNAKVMKYQISKQMWTDNKLNFMLRPTKANRPADNFSHNAVQHQVLRRRYPEQAYYTDYREGNYA